MRILAKLYCILPIILILLLTSCASTKVTNEWKDPNFSSSKFNKILILGVAKQPAQRKFYEDTFVQLLEEKGIIAIPSHTLVTHDEMLAERAVVKDTIAHKIKDMDFDGVIVTRVRGSKEKIQPKTTNSFYHYYDNSLSAAFSSRTISPSYTQEFSLESKLYDTKTEKLVFSLSTDTVAQNNINKRLYSYIKIFVNKLIQNKLI